MTTKDGIRRCAKINTYNEGISVVLGLLCYILIERKDIKYNSNTQIQCKPDYLYIYMPSWSYRGARLEYSHTYTYTRYMY